jgi:hypothetical protein
MNKRINKDLSVELKELYASNPVAKALFDWFATRQKDARETPVDRSAWMTERERSEIRELFQHLEGLGLGRFIVGRKGHKSRMAWEFSIRSIARAAQGAREPIADIDPEMVEEWIDDESSDEAEDGLLGHEFQLRAGLKVSIKLPEDFTSKEAERLAAFVKSIPFE